MSNPLGEAVGATATASEQRVMKVPKIASRLLGIVGLLGLLLMLTAPTVFVPAEDATILFQYSDNWAATKQITYYAGGPRVEGATDFLWMAVLAAFRMLHVAPFWATAAINVVAAFTIAYLLLLLAGKSVTLWRLLIPIGLITVMPQFGAALAGFSVLPFSALILLAAFFFYRKRDVALGLSCFFLCLFRPDGTVFAVPLIAFRIFAGREGVLRRLLIYASVFALPGLLYFRWRWHYFGEFLPLPFLVKGDTPRFLGIALGTSNIDILKYLVFDTVLLAFVLGSSRLRVRANAQLLLSLGIVPSMFYAAMRLDQDIADRFFAYLVVCAAVLVAINWQDLRLTKSRAVVVFAASWLVCLSLQWLSGMSRFFSDGYKNTVVAISQELHGIHPNGTLALSEAGRIAYFSGWPTVDMWGLNTPEFAHHLLTSKDIQRVSPDLLVLYYPQAQHDCRFQQGWDTPHTQRTWPNLAQNVITGVHDSDNYDLWMVPSSGLLRRAILHNRPGAGEYQCWFVKRTFSGHDQVVDILERHAALPETQFLQIRLGSADGRARAGAGYSH